MPYKFTLFPADFLQSIPEERCSYVIKKECLFNFVLFYQGSILKNDFETIFLNLLLFCGFCFRELQRRAGRIFICFMPLVGGSVGKMKSSLALKDSVYGF